MFLESLSLVFQFNLKNLNKRPKPSIFVASIFDVYRFRTWFRIKHIKAY